MKNNRYKTIGLAFVASCLAVMSSSSFAGFVLSERVSQVYFEGGNFDTESNATKYNGLPVDRVIYSTHLGTDFNHQLRDNITIDPILIDGHGPNTGQYDVSQNTMISSNVISSSASAFATVLGDSSPVMIVQSLFQFTFTVDVSTEILLTGGVFDGPSTVDKYDYAVLHLKKGAATIFSVTEGEPQHSFPGNTNPEDFSYSVILDPNYTYSLVSRISAQSLNGTIQTAGSSFTLTAVPVPAAFWLFGTGFIALIGLKKRG